jgi:hypothetical protein
MTPLEMVKLTWKLYVPTVVMGGATIACIIGSNSINLRRNAALASLYSLTETALQEYKEKVIETLGEKKEEKIKSAILQDKLEKDPVDEKQVIITGGGDVLCYESLSARYFRSSVEKIISIQNKFNHCLLSERYMTLNELYDELGLEHCSLGERTGWSTEFGLLDIKFESKIAANKEPCLVLEYRIGPRGL